MRMQIGNKTESLLPTNWFKSYNRRMFCKVVTVELLLSCTRNQNRRCGAKELYCFAFGNQNRKWIRSQQLLFHTRNRIPILGTWNRKPETVVQTRRKTKHTQNRRIEIKSNYVHCFLCNYVSLNISNNKKMFFSIEVNIKH